MTLDIIILAAGRGTRMRSSRPKVLQPLAGRPLLAHVIGAARELAPRTIHVVIGHGADAVRDALSAPDINWVEQPEQLGTAHAVLQALPGVPDDGTVLVLYGDVPLLPASTLHGLVAASPALLTARFDDPAGYGRILRNAAGDLEAVVEDRDASTAQRCIDEVNTGILAMSAAALKRYLPRVDNSNTQQEYYLPEVLPMAIAEGVAITTVGAVEPGDVLGINDRAQLAAAEREFQRRKADSLLAGGVTLADPARLDQRGSLRCGQDVFIDINCVFEGEVVLGDRVHIGPNCVLRDCRIAAGTTVHAMSHLDGAESGSNCSIGPFARLRPGTALADAARIGNFVETKNATIGAGSKVNHLSYIGDSSLGSSVNIGAGTITCNYDGINKHPTEIGDGVFVGSNTTLVAPVAIGKGSFVAAGSTVTRDVDSGDLAVGRAKQRNISGWRRPDKRSDPVNSGD